MKIQQSITAIENYHRPDFNITVIQPQQAQILEKMQHGKDYTIRELAHVTHMDRSNVSARRNAMLKLGLIEYGPSRKCMFSEKFVETVKLKGE